MKGENVHIFTIGFQEEGGVQKGGQQQSQLVFEEKNL